MTELVSTALAGITHFIVTNIDDVFVLVGFFADRTVRARNIVIGQFLGSMHPLARESPNHWRADPSLRASRIAVRIDCDRVLGVGGSG